MQSKTLTIMFVDVQGYTSLTSQTTRDEHQLFLKEIQQFVQKHVALKFGTLVKTMGDGFLITFESPTNAISCGMNMQKEIQRRNANVLNENNFVSLRIGISTGEVSVDESGDVFGDAVNIAARIQKFSEPNEVFISETTYLAMNKTEIQALDLGPQKFKNVIEEVRVFKVLKEGQVPSGLAKTVKPQSWLLFLIWIIVGVALVIGVVFLMIRGKEKKNLKQTEALIMQRIKQRSVSNGGGPVITQEEFQKLTHKVRKMLLERREMMLKRRQQEGALDKEQMRPMGEEGSILTPEEFEKLPADVRKLLKEEKEQRLQQELLNKEQMRPMGEEGGIPSEAQKYCGDNYCDDHEKNSPGLCPADCNYEQIQMNGGK